jgi:hypothetical protein
MPILNYTTTIEVSKTLGEISAMLAKAKAAAILTELEEGIVSAISFRIKTEFGLLTFRLPANTQRFYEVIVRDRRITPKIRTREQAARAAWRTVKDWLEAQLAMIEAGLVDLEQVFLPYAQNQAGQTVYEIMKSQRFSNLLLDPGAMMNTCLFSQCRISPHARS